MKKIVSILLLCLATNLMAQKLPEIQTLALAVPISIKIDGKDKEWNNVFAAENKRTELLYSLTNDDKNLYLVVKSLSPTAINKIMLGGLTFMLNLAGKKREKNAISLTYPLIARNNAATNRNRQGQNRPLGGQGNVTRNTKQSDSVLSALRKTQLAAVKEIKVIGFAHITDTLISIYNEFGIKAVANISNDGFYFYELALPLATVGLASNQPATFMYQIKINGLSTLASAANAFQRNQNNFVSGARGFNSTNASSSVDLTSPVSFWGKYTLLK